MVLQRLVELETEVSHLVQSDRYQAAKAELIACVLESSRRIQGIRPPRRSAEEVGEAPLEPGAYLRQLKEFERARGRDLYFPYLSSGMGQGPYVELEDGSVKLDLITGIGVNFFGHTHPELLSERVDSIASDVMQSNLQPGVEARDFLQALLARVGPKSRLAHGWTLCSGTMVNEAALKIIRQKQAPATRVLAFQNCFAGRSTALQEITDNPSYRVGQPTYGEVDYLPFYDPAQGLQASILATLQKMRAVCAEFSGQIAGLLIELVQGEGGFLFAPRDYYVRVFEEAKAQGLAIWVDEVQTFGRTGELFAYQTLGLSEWVDVVTVGKLLQACAVLYTPEYNPKPGLLAGTYLGSTAAMRVGRRILELLEEEGFLGPAGKIQKRSAAFVSRLQELASGTCRGLIQEVRALGGMIAFQPGSGQLAEVQAVLNRLFELGLVAFYCGRGPYLIRLLPPFGVLTERHLDEVFVRIEQALLEVLSPPSLVFSTAPVSHAALQGSSRQESALT
jgi:4-aminobutyrate aminotransferase-like enzyme